MQILNRGGFNVIHVTDGSEHEEAIRMINSNEADGMNLNYVKNQAKNLNFIMKCPNIRYLQINDSNCNYSVVNSLINLEKLDIYTDYNSEIMFNNLPKLKSATIFWRPKAKSIFECSKLERLFLGKYTDKNLYKLNKLTNLKYLRINTGSIQTLDGIDKLQELTELILMQISSLKSINGIQKLLKLESLHIDNCKNITDINKINFLPKNISVVLSGTTININK